MLQIGSAFKQARLDKNMRQKEVAKGILSVPQLSKFENNKSQITADKFFLLLDRINVTTTEFQVVYLNNELYNQSSIIKNIADAYYQGNILHLQSLLRDQIKLYEIFGSLRFYHNQIWIQQFIRGLQNLPYDHTEVSKIYHYLTNVENWGSYEIVLFSNLSFAFNLTQLKQLSRTAIKKIDIYRNKGVFSNLYHLTATLLGNLTTIFIDNDELDLANKMLHETDKLLKDTDFLSEKIHHQFRQGIYLIKLGRIEEGKNLAEKSIHQLISFELFDLAQYFKKELEGYLPQK